MSSAIAQLEHPSLREKAARRLKAGIVTGEIETGRLYTVGEFAERFGVSATPVREALGDLVGAGLVEVIRNRGFMVPKLTEHDLHEIFDLRLMLEVPAVAQVAGRLSEADRAKARELVDQGKEHARNGDLAAFFETNSAFHLTLLEALGNKRLLDIVGKLRDQARLTGLDSLHAADQMLTSAKEHEELLLAIERGDSEAARTLMSQHLEHMRGVWTDSRGEQAVTASAPDRGV
jgi:DNA-binding GntR family transcriptional regulator